MRISKIWPRKPFLIIASIVASSIFFAEVSAQEKIDSLKALLKNDRQDTTRVNLLIDLARELYRSGNFLTSLQTAREARALGNQPQLSKRYWQCLAGIRLRLYPEK
ncbi:hypothetical protein [Ohtaekwangia koreensis]|uniref:Tetratricopeptide repeat-containing protein n=1 Tax=Ohtaekwangia koreensis TaxID=688867 RepID=A0A1T5JBQ1_9BACT|nr:hypothetical protein [Ohtaekwangia koreensis]SKC48835.1 hypothetical protein SAMN05660236_0954 [Ohtaekwangia koreensis]